MKEIIELNKRLVEVLGGGFSDGVVILDRNDQPDELMRLPAALREAIEKLRHEINQVVPDDFTFCLLLGDTDPGLTIEYQDGAQTAFWQACEWHPDRSIIEQLRGFDWAKEREQAITNCQILDAMKEEAKHQPSRLPSTKTLQRRFGVEMKEFFKAKRKEAEGVHVLMWRDDEAVKVESFENEKSFCRELPDIMTVQFMVIAVVVNGKPVSRDGVENMKRKAIAELEDMPISHAKALCKL